MGDVGTSGAAAMAALDAAGLAEVGWDGSAGGAVTVPAEGLVASAADERGRGILLTVTVTAADGDAAADLSGFAMTLLWRHRGLRRRGAERMTAVDAADGKWLLYWPRELAASEGTVECQVMLAWATGRAISSAAFEVKVGPLLARELGGCGCGTMNLAEAAERYDAAALVLEEAAGKVERLVDETSGVAAAAKSATDAAASANDAAAKAAAAAGNADAAKADLLDVKAKLLKAQADGAFTGPAGPEGPQGPQGETGPQGPAGKDGTTPDLTGYATQDWVTAQIAAITDLSEKGF